MQNSVFKITGFFAMLTMVFASCNQDDFVLVQDIDEESFQYKTMSVFCQSSKNEEISTKSLKRNTEGAVVEEITSRDGKPDHKITRSFQSNGLQNNDSTFYYFEGKWKLQGATQMNYNRNDLAEELFYGSDGICRNKTVYTYENGKLKWEDHYYFDNNRWGFQYGYKYEFDRNGNIIN